METPINMTKSRFTSLIEFVKLERKFAKALGIPADHNETKEDGKIGFN
jgi:hypothetical protein